MSEVTDDQTLRIKIFADGADLGSISRLAENPLIKGFTTNPTLMRQAGVSDYRVFAHEVLKIVPERPISFEVFSDDFDEMERQAHEIGSWGHNVYVKIPVTDTNGEFSGPVIRRLSSAGLQINVTAVMSTEQVLRVSECLSDKTSSFVSVFAGRIADTGRDPVPVMERSLELLRELPAELIWASPRELLNLFQADEIGCHIITMTSGVLSKMPLIGKDLESFSLDTVRMFSRDAIGAGYEIELPAQQALPEKD